MSDLLKIQMQIASVECDLAELKAKEAYLKSLIQLPELVGKYVVFHERDDSKTWMKVTSVDLSGLMPIAFGPSISESKDGTRIRINLEGVNEVLEGWFEVTDEVTFNLSLSRLVSKIDAFPELISKI